MLRSATFSFPLLAMLLCCAPAAARNAPSSGEGGEGQASKPQAASLPGGEGAGREAPPAGKTESSADLFGGHGEGALSTGSIGCYAPTPAGVVDTLGRFHPLLVHFPLAWLLLLVLADMGSFFLGFREWRRAGALLLFATLVSMVPAVLSGLMREDFVSGFFKEQLVHMHRNLMLGMSGTCLAAFLIRLRARNELEGTVRTLYLALMVLVLLLGVLGGHFGAKMVFGPRYLPF